MKASDIPTDKEVDVRKLPVVVKAIRLDGPLQVPTLEGVMWASEGDILITGIQGEKYPCKPDIFEKTYELVTDPGAQKLILPDRKVKKLREVKGTARMDGTKLSVRTGDKHTVMDLSKPKVCAGIISILHDMILRAEKNEETMKACYMKVMDALGEEVDEPASESC